MGSNYRYYRNLARSLVLRLRDRGLVHLEGISFASRGRHVAAAFQQRTRLNDKDRCTKISPKSPRRENLRSALSLYIPEHLPSDFDIPNLNVGVHNGLLANNQF